MSLGAASWLVRASAERLHSKNLYLGDWWIVPIRAVDLSEIPAAHPVVVFHRFWSKAAAAEAWAPWSAFDPAEHPAILPWVLLLRREPAADESAAPAWRYTVCGTGCTGLFGFSYQGKLFGEDLPPDAAAERMVEFERAIGGDGAQFSATRLPIPGKDFVKVFRGVFPFAAGPAGVDRLFVVLAREDTRV